MSEWRGLGPGSRVLLDARALQGADAQRGIGSYVRGLILGLREEGFDVCTALLFEAGADVPPVPAGDFVAYTVRRRYNGRLGRVEEAMAMPGDLRRIGPAVYHATTLALPSASPVPLVATVHDLIPWALGGSRLLGERTRWWLGRRLLHHADLVIAPSKATAEDARRLARVDGERLLVIPEGLAPGFVPAEGAAERVAERYGLRKPYLLFVGALDARKDPRALLRAWEVAREAGADVELVLAGGDSRQAPADMGAARRLGYLQLPELVDLYAAATCLVFPTRYEGFGLTLLEAMGCGCPVVTYRNSSLPEVAGDAAVLVPDGDAEALGRAAAEVALRPDVAVRLRHAGLARAARFSWRKTARATIAAYERAVRQVSEAGAATPSSEQVRDPSH
ncbi:MAG TPA: glycosyltransferase family 1 protein [Candidatus Dormibacteraeota bacterium]|nr:glycosyltransferase family 1 protein [Candidatus Dormibacteraeota bacterium]